MAGEHRRSGRVPGFDGLRGVAVLLVTVSHAGVPVLKYGGITGVTLFFVLSGYLITTLLVEEWTRHRSISLPAFYARRALRLLPALVVALAGGWVLAVAFGASPGDTAKAALITLVYVNNLGRLLDVGTGPFGILWSLSLEEQYYLIWPLVVIVLLPVLKTGGLAWASLGLGVASLVVRFTGPIRTASGFEDAMYLPHTAAYAILFGSALALFLRGPVRPLPGWAATAAMVWILLASSVLAMRSGLEETADSTSYVLRLVAGPSAAVGAVVLVTFVAQHSPGHDWLTHPVLLFFGTISYGLYLWHGILDWVLGNRYGSQGVHGLLTGSTAAVLAVGLAVLSHRYVEAPFLRYKRRFSPDAVVVR